MQIFKLFNRVNGFDLRHPEQPPPQTSLEEKQLLLSHHVRLVARGITNGLFVAGTGGLGKSKTINSTLAQERVVPVLINSHVTPLGLYRTLYEHRKDEILWLDDCDSIYSNLQILGLLRSALWGDQQRIVTYTSSQLDDLPSSFVFESRIIFCANNFPKRNEAFKAVLSRVDCFELVASNEEVIEQMRYLANSGYENLSRSECHELVSFIEGFCSNRQLSMRLYEPSLKKLIYAKESDVDWKEMVACQLTQLGSKDTPVDSSKVYLFQVINEAKTLYPDSVKDQEHYWKEKTKKSRASFYRAKKDFEANESNDAEPNTTEGENHE